MIELKLQADTPELQRIKDYLQENASGVLADKINKGTPFDKDGKPLVNKKTLDGFMQYAVDEAKKLAEKNARYACVEDKTVFGWAIHYFEEDSIEGSLFYMDGAEYKPAPKRIAPTTISKKVEPPKKDTMQFSLFDTLEEVPANSGTEEDELDNAIKGQVVTEDGEIIDYEEFDGNLDNEPEEEPIVAPTSVQEPKGSPLYQRYKRIQDAYPTSVILLRLGDFYECFDSHGVELAEELDLTLTGRDLGLSERVPMVGFPYHCADAYFKKITAVHDLVIIESDKDSETKYLPKTQPKTGDFATIKNEVIDRLIAIFGKDLEVKI